MYNEVLKKERERKDITQKEFAKMLGLKQQQYARYEKGINLMPITLIKPICLILNISSDYLLGIKKGEN